MFNHKFCDPFTFSRTMEPETAVLWIYLVTLLLPVLLSWLVRHTTLISTEKQ